MFSTLTRTTVPWSTANSRACPGRSVCTWTRMSDWSPTAITDSPSASMRVLTSATGRSTSRSRYSVQKPKIDSSSMASTSARLYGCAWASSSTERPVDHIQAPSRITRNPSPPESTTPALRSTWSWVGVAATASLAARTTWPSMSGRSALAPAAALAATPTSRATVRIVPSTGRLTPRYATSLAVAKAVARPAGVSSSMSASASAKPRSNCDRMTPELPRAPSIAAS